MTARGTSSRQRDSLDACESLRGLPDLQLEGGVELQCRYLDVLPQFVPDRLGDGGDEETRTPDPLLAKEMLFQLSYVPLPETGANVDGGRFWTRTRDLCLIRAVL